MLRFHEQSKTKDVMQSDDFDLKDKDNFCASIHACVADYVPLENEQFQELVIESKGNHYVAHIEKILDVDFLDAKPVDADEAIEAIKNLPHKTNLLTDESFTQLQAMLRKHKDLLQPPDGKPLSVVTKHVITEKPGAIPSYERARRLGPAEMTELHKQIQFLLGMDYIEPTKSPYGAPVIFAPKKDGSLRLACDFRKLNRQTVIPEGGLPKIEEIFDIIGQPGKKVFSSMDLRWGFWNILNTPETAQKATITTPLGSYAWKVLPFGVSGAPRTMQFAMEEILRPFLSKFCMVYLDDVFIFSDNEEQHAEHLRLILAALEKAKMKINLAKCQFFKSEINCLGWIIGVDGRRVQPSKIKAITAWPIPKNAPEIAQFMGAVKHLAPVIPNLSEMAVPLNEATHGLDIKKRQSHPPPVEWTKDMQKSFDALKSALTSPAVLRIPDITKPFTIQCDASGKAIAATLFQNYDGKDYPVAYISKKLSDQEQRWPIGEKEAFSFVYAFKKWDHYLFGAKVEILGDHKPLIALRTNPKPTRKQAGWLAFLESFDYIYNHIKGENNVLADAMSRRSDYVDVNFTTLVMYLMAEDDFDLYGKVDIDYMPRDDDYSCGAPLELINTIFGFPYDIGSDIEDSIYDVSALNVAYINHSAFTYDNLLSSKTLRESDALPSLQKLQSWLANPSNLYAHDKTARQAILDIRADKPTDFVLESSTDVLFYRTKRDNKPRLFVPEVMQATVMDLIHSSPLAGHLGNAKTTEKVKRHFYWPGMDADIVEHVSKCVVCQKFKYRTHKPPSLHLPFDIPDHPWQVFHMDFKTGLPTATDGSDAFLIVTCKLTKMSHVIPCKSTISAIETGDLLFEHVFKLHGFPEKIISDRDPRFTSAEWRDMFEHLYTRLGLSTARHPQTDGQAERGVRTFVEMLRVFCNENAKGWHRLIGACEYAYNDSLHPSTGFTPFQLNFGRDPNTPISLLIRSYATVPPGSTHSFQHLKHYATAIEQTKRSLHKSNEKQAARLAARSSGNYYFEPGDWVYLENPTKLNLSDLAPFAERYIGPLLVTRVVAPNVYELDTSTDSRVRLRHPVFNGDKLKPASGPSDSEPSKELLDFENSLLMDTPLLDALRPPLVQLPPVTRPQAAKTVKSGTLSIESLDYSVDMSNEVETHSLSITLTNGKKHDAVEFFGNNSPFSTKSVKDKFFGQLRQKIDSLLLPPSAPRVVQDYLGKYFTANTKPPIGCIILAVDVNDGMFILYSDGDSVGLEKSEVLRTLKNAPAIHAITAFPTSVKDVSTFSWDMHDPLHILALLQLFQPGDWQSRHATQLCNKMYGGTRFNPLLVRTDNVEIIDFAQHLNVAHLKLKKGLDPFAGTRTIPTTFKRQFDVLLQSNDVNGMFPCNFKLDGINPQSYTVDKLGRFDYVITSIPFAFADIAVPLLISKFEAAFFHLPSWYCFQGSRFRHDFLKKLVLERRIIVLNVNTTRNQEFGRYAIWLCVFRTRDLAHKYLKRVNRLFENSLPVFFGNSYGPTASN